MLNTKIPYSLKFALNYRFLKTARLGFKSYLQATITNGNSALIPEGARSIGISSFAKIGGGLFNDVYSTSLSYRQEGRMRNSNYVLKTYLDSKDPYDLVRKAYGYKWEVPKWMREFHVLKYLNSIGFSVPKVLACESDRRFLGYPFLIMQQEKVVAKKIADIVDHFAAELANLHNIKLASLDLNFLLNRQNEFEFARSWSNHYKQYLSLETKHSKKLREDFKLAIRWLDSNASKNSCPQYCFLHGDYHPGNVCSTSGSKLVVLDWDSIEIGDPALDVGYAYHFVKFFSNPENPDSAEPIAKRFVSEYEKTFEGDISARLDFYKMVGILGTSISYSSGLSNPIFDYRYHRRKVMPAFPLLNGLLILLGFPFIRHPIVARQLAAQGDLLWLKYFQNFLEAKLKR